MYFPRRWKSYYGLINGEKERERRTIDVPENDTDGKSV